MIFIDIWNRFQAMVSGNIGEIINEKFKNVLVKNMGFEFIQQISNILIDETTII
jgi:hypothetical protein